jgi:hypothetical protein
MMNYVGRREQFIGNCGQQNDTKDVTEGADIFKFDFDAWLDSISSHLPSDHDIKDGYK